MSDTLHRPNLEKMLSDAIKAGWTVSRVNGMVYVAKYTKHKKPRLIDGLAIFEDGEAIRMGVDLTICKAIKTVKEMRALLGIVRDINDTIMKREWETKQV